MRRTNGEVECSLAHEQSGVRRPAAAWLLRLGEASRESEVTWESLVKACRDRQALANGEVPASHKNASPFSSTGRKCTERTE